MTIFVGRHDELATIQTAAVAAAAGRPMVVFIEGPAGAGKTALVREAQARLASEFTIVAAHADDLASDVAMWLLREVVDVTTTAPFAAGLELVAHLGELQAHGPVALIVEDLHWADEPSRHALLAAVRRMAGDRVLVVVTSREDDRDDRWDRVRLDSDRCVRIPLGPLSRQEVAELASVTSGVRLDGRAAERLHRHTAGHALYVRTLLAELTEARLTAPVGELPAPRSLTSTALARLAELSSPSIALAGALAVLGDRSPLVTVGRVGRVDGPTAALDDLLRSGLVTWAPTDPQNPVSFVHPLYRSAVYEDLSPSRRQALHLAASEVTDADAALGHRVAAADHVDEPLAAELEASLGRPGKPLDPPRAAKHLLWAAGLSSTRADSHRRLLDAACVLLRSGQLNATRDLRLRLEACADGPRRSLVLGMLAWHDGDAVAAEQLLQAADRQVDTDPRAADEAVVFLGEMYTNQSRGQEAVDVARRSLDRGCLDDDEQRAAVATLAIGVGQVHGAARGLDALDDQRPLDTPERSSSASAQLQFTRGMLSFYAGRPSAAVDELQALVDLARSVPVAAYLPRAHVLLAQARLALGDWDGALVNAHVAVDLATDEAHVWSLAQAHGAAAMVAAGRGALDDATRHVEAAKAAAGDTPTLEAIYLWHLAEAALARARGDADGVVAALGPLTGGNSGAAIPMFTTLGWWPTLIGALIAVDRLDDADVQITHLKEAADVRAIDLRMRTLALQGRLAVARHQAETASAAFEAAVAAIGADDPLLDRAELHHHFGRHLRARGDRRQAIDQLRAAHDLLRNVGATPYLDRVEQDLADTGTSTAPGSRGRPAALTDREHDVVTLVARGMTNREAAAALYVSPKAVEYHLGNVFAKLGITSRRQLRDWAAD